METITMGSSNRKLSSLARHVIYPQNNKTTGWPAVKSLAAECGITFDPWQNGLGTIVLGKKADGTYSAGVGGIVVSICRQVGKTFLFGTMAFILCILNEGMKVLWTAHRSRTSDETFKSMQGLARTPRIATYIQSVRQANGQQEIVFVNGSRILFGARENGFGRGFDDVDIEIFDEAQILTEKALDDMVPAMNTARNPLLILMGTPPKPSDPSEVFRTRRAEALKGDTEDMVFVEFSADRTATSDDRAQWAKANPSYPSRTSEAAILRMQRNLSEDSFRREGLGIWDETTTQSAINLTAWEQQTVDKPTEGGLLAAALDMSPDRRWLSVGIARKFEDGSAHVELAAHVDTHVAGVNTTLDWVADHWSRLSAVVIDAQSPAMVLVEELSARKIPVTVSTYQQMGQACGRFQDLLTAGKLTHLDEMAQEPLYAAVRNATTRKIGSGGAFGWNRIGSDIDISPLVAVSLSLQGAWTSKRRPGRKQRMASY